MVMKRLKRPTEPKPGKVFQTGSSPTDSTRIDLSYSYQILGGVGNTNRSSRVQDGGKSRHAKRSASNVQSAGSSRSLVIIYKGEDSNVDFVNFFLKLKENYHK